MRKRYFVIINLLLLVFIFSACKGKDSEGPVVKKEEGVISKGNEGGAGSSPQQADIPASSDSPVFYKITATPESPKVGDVIKINVAKSDKSEVDASSITYEWKKNGELLNSETSSTLKTAGIFKRGDKIEATVTVAERNGKKSSWLVSLIIVNSPPEIVSVSDITKVDNNRFGFQVKAKDPDGDELKYSLKFPIAGVTIDHASGNVLITVAENASGKTPISVSVTDGNGGEATYTTNVIVSASPGQ